MIVYFDMDGVLSNLDGYLTWLQEHDCFQLHGPRDVVLAQACKRYGHRNVFYALSTIKRPMMIQWMTELYSQGVSVQILTSLGTTNALDCLGRYRGKIDWLHRFYHPQLKDGIIERVNVVTTCDQKKLYAKDQTILIDDQRDNVYDFNKAGGLGVLYTQEHHEACYKLVDNAI
tara:strand:+ start:403 stop:921 length:519 start_codon:yes stop_codon:yes gene_type:complete